MAGSRDRDNFVRLAAVIIRTDRQVIRKAVTVISEPLSAPRSDAKKVFNARTVGVALGDEATIPYMTQSLGSCASEGARAP